MDVEDDDGCIHGLGPVSSCTLCNGRAAREAKIHTEGTTFPAQYRSTCGECGNEFDVGTRIGKLSNGRYAHEACWLHVKIGET